jgi:HAD superfamily hydrolase (TIGR01509 family)
MTAPLKPAKFCGPDDNEPIRLTHPYPGLRFAGQHGSERRKGGRAVLRALIFDVDGTLAETEELHRIAFNTAFAEAGLDWEWDPALYRALLAVTGGKERIAHYQQRECTQPALSAEQIAALHVAKTAHYTTALRAAGLALRPGVRRLLHEAHQAGVKRAIATTTTRANIDSLLATTQDVPPFDVIAAGDDAAAKKPAPDIYLHALAALGLPASEAIALEDSINGLASARGAGLACVVTPSAYGDAGPFPGAAAVITNLGEHDAPANVLAGPPPPGGIADLAWLETLARKEAVLF